MTAQKECRGYAQGGIAPHMADDDAGPSGFGPGKTQCRKCYAAYYEDWKAGRTPGAGKRRRARAKSAADFRYFRGEIDDDAETVSDGDLAESRSHEYRPDPDLVSLWHSVVTAAAAGSHPQNLLFLGPSGSGKTDGAAYLAALIGLPFTKVDAASMTDSVDWFGTREVVSDGGASVTVYSPSAFVEAIQRPGVLLIDEVNRIRDEHRNVLLPLLDGTHRVTNPLTGDVVVKDPRCFVILSGNRGLQFTGTYAIDPALMTRALVVEFGYAVADWERQIAVEAGGCDEATADLLVRFANETRERAKADPDMSPVSTREVIAAARLIAGGLSADLAVKYTSINAASDEGGAASVRSTLEVIWAGVRKGDAAQAAPRCTRCGITEASHIAADHDFDTTR